MSEWGRLYEGSERHEGAERGRGRQDRDFEALERERQERRTERRRLRREVEEQEEAAMRRRSKGWGSEWEREEARWVHRKLVE